MSTETRTQLTERMGAKRVYQADLYDWSGVISSVTTIYDVVPCRQYSSKTGQYGRRPKGFLAPTNYSSVYRSGDTNGFSGHYSKEWFGASSQTVYTSGSLTESNPGFYGVGDPYFVSQGLVDKAVLELRSRLKNQKVNLSMAFAERKQTANLITSTATRLRIGIKAAVKGDIKGLKRALGIPPIVTRRDRKALRKDNESPRYTADGSRAASRLWLENRYGWLPLLGDVKGSAEALASNDVDDPSRYSVAVKASSSTNLKDEYEFTDWYIPCRIVIKKSVTVTTGAFVRVDAHLENRALATASSLGLTNPLAVAWDRLPWSFVVDWVSPVGKYLNAMDAELGWTFLSGSISKRVKETWVTRIEYAGSQPWYGRASGNGTGYQGSLNRNVLTAFPDAKVGSLFPKNPISTGHVLNALALLRLAIPK